MTLFSAIGIRCNLHRLDDGSVYVSSRRGSGPHTERGFFGRAKFRVFPGDNTRPDMVVAERPQDETAIVQQVAGGFAPSPWVPSISATFTTWAGGSVFPAFDIHTDWSIEAEPLFYPDSSQYPLYGAGATYHLKIVLGTTTILDSDQLAGDSGSVDTVGPFTAPVTCTATLTHDTTVIDTVTFTFT